MAKTCTCFFKWPFWSFNTHENQWCQTHKVIPIVCLHDTLHYRLAIKMQLGRRGVWLALEKWVKHWPTLSARGFKEKNIPPDVDCFVFSCCKCGKYGDTLLMGNAYQLGEGAEKKLRAGVICHRCAKKNFQERLRQEALKKGN